MSKASLAIYAERARVLADPWLASARYAEQRGSLDVIVEDIAAKLDLGPADELLDIGSGTGLLTVPLSHRVARTTVIDHADCLARFPAGVVRAMPGDALGMDLGEGLYSKVLIYDVIHYLGLASEAIALLRKGIRALMSGGRMLVGDLPNSDKRARFAASDFGAIFEGAWRSQPHDDGSAVLSEEPDPLLVRVDDVLVLALLCEARALGCDAYVLPQPDQLPFGYVREDILVVRP